MKKKILIGIGILFLICIFTGSFIFLHKYNELFLNNNELNYNLVFNAKYYAELNPDIAEMIGNNEEDLLNHFKEKGMAEGRKAAFNFDVNYYKDNNLDLQEQFGSDLEQYYIHYIEYGFFEGRRGSIDDISKNTYDVKLSCQLSSDYILRANLEFEKEYQFKTYYLFELASYENDINKGEIISKGLFQDRIILSNINITNKFVVCIKEDGEYKQVSNFAYIQNPEANCTYKINESSISAPLSKKGLLVDLNKDEIQYIQDLNPTFINVDFYMDDIIITNLELVEQEKIISYDYNNKTYYFNLENITKLDEQIKYYNDLGVNIISSILLRNNANVNELFYQNINQDLLNGVTYMAIDTSREESEQYFEAFINFISKRYNGDENSKGCISRWIIGNKVNLNVTNNFMGEKEINDYTEEYVRTFNIAYNLIKSNNRIAKIYISIEKWWEIKSDNLNYSGREFLSCFNSMIKTCGNSDWDLIYNVSSYPENDPNYLNDDEAMLLSDGLTEDYSKIAINNFDTFSISISNISVLTEYLKQDVLLNSNGESRSLIIFNNGITSNSKEYGVSESVQAAQMLYAFYKAELNDSIDAIMFTSLHDDYNLLLEDVHKSFGMLYKDVLGNDHMKLSYEVFKIMDNKDSITKNDYLKKVLDINAESFKNILDEFDEEYLKTVLNNPIKYDYNENTNEDAADNGSISIIDSLIKNNNIINDNRTDIATLEIKFKDDINVFNYTGENIFPEISVASNQISLINDQDYDCLFYNNKDIGIGYVLIIGINSFNGFKILEFNIV